MYGRGAVIRAAGITGRQYDHWRMARGDCPGYGSRAVFTADDVVEFAVIGALVGFGYSVGVAVEKARWVVALGAGCWSEDRGHARLTVDVAGIRERVETALACERRVTTRAA